MIRLWGYVTYYNAIYYSEVAPVKSNTCCSSGPYLRVAKHYLGWIILISRKNAYVTLAVTAVAHAIDSSMIHIQIDGAAVGYNCPQVGLIQTSLDGSNI